MAIPVVDFAYFLDGNEVDKKEVSLQIDQAFRDVGFVYLKNHSVPLPKVEECFQWVCFIRDRSLQSRSFTYIRVRNSLTSQRKRKCSLLILPEVRTIAGTPG
jgi:non-heme dioxygenase-like protein